MPYAEFINFAEQQIEAMAAELAATQFMRFNIYNLSGLLGVGLILVNIGGYLIPRAYW